MPTALIRLIVYTAALLAFALAAAGCASAIAPVTQPAVALPTGPTDVHVLPDGVYIDLHVADAYPMCVQHPIDTEPNMMLCFPIGQLRAWLDTLLRAQPRESSDERVDGVLMK